MTVQDEDEYSQEENEEENDDDSYDLRLISKNSLRELGECRHC